MFMFVFAVCIRFIDYEIIPRFYIYLVWVLFSYYIYIYNILYIYPYSFIFHLEEVFTVPSVYYPIIKVTSSSRCAFFALLFCKEASIIAIHNIPPRILFALKFKLFSSETSFFLFIFSFLFFLFNFPPAHTRREREYTLCHYILPQYRNMSTCLYIHVYILSKYTHMRLVVLSLEKKLS